MTWQRHRYSSPRKAALLLACLPLFPIFAQNSLNVSHDLVPLGIAAGNMEPNQPTLDSGPLLFQAVEYAKQHQIPLVTADRGVYYFLSLQNTNWHVQLLGINNMTIDLNGSDLIFTHPLQDALYMGFNTNAVFQNFTVDYQPLPFTQVSVVSVNPSLAQINYAVLPGWQDPSAFNTAPAGTIVEVHIFRNGQPAYGTRRMAAQSPIAGKLITIIPYDIDPTPQNMSMIRPGDVAVVAMRTTNATIVTDRCSGCTLRNIGIYSGTTAAVSAYFSPSSTFERVYMIPKPGTDRLVSAYGINSITPGPNSRIRLNRAIRSMDDGFGLFNWMTGTVQSQASSRILTVAGTTNTALLWLVGLPNGSPVAFERPLDGSILASAVVVSQTASSPTAQPYVVTFTFDRDLPSGLAGAYMYATDPNLRGANSVMERNLVHSSSSCCTGIDIGGWASYSTIHGNYVHQSAFAGIMANQHLEENCCDDRTTPLVNVTLSNNVIDGANLSPVQNLWSYSLGALQLSTLRSDQNGITGLMPTSPHQNIRITDNFIADSGRSAVWVGNTAGGTVSGNYFLDPGGRPDLPDGNAGYSADATVPLVIDSTSSGIAAADNVIDQSSLRVFVTDTAFGEMAAYPPGGAVRLNAYGIGQLSGPAVTLTDADGNATPLTILNTAPHSFDVRIPSSAALGGAFLTLTSDTTKYFGTLFVDSQDNIPAVNGCTYQIDPSATSVPVGASSLPILVVTQAGCPYQVRATDAFVNPGGSAIGTAVIQVGFAANTGLARSATIEIAGRPIALTQAANPMVSLSRSSLNFGVKGSLITSPQSIDVSFANAAGLSWTASSNQPNITVSPSAGAGNGSFLVTVTPGPSGVVTVIAPGAANSPRQVQINVASAGSINLLGNFETPLNKSTGIAGAIPVTGWALDGVQVSKVDVWREPLQKEATAPNGLVYIGDAVFVAGARPDVEQAYPAAPLNYRGGWGYMMLTNFLPNSDGSPDWGNGTYKLHAIAHNSAGTSVDLGVKTITVDNSHASRPFGTIDTPAQGGVASGSAYVNFGWALTQNPYVIPVDGSTLNVYVDGVPLGHPIYNQYRSDIATLFPGLANSNGAVGLFVVDTTQLANGVHTIAWTVGDSANRGDGIGSRYFSVFNGSSLAAMSQPADHPLGAPDPPGTIEVQETGRIELPVSAASGYLLFHGKRRPLPIGSTLKGGVFYWQLGPGFLGAYDLEFKRLRREPVRMRVVVRPKAN